jgi:tellurite resistance protein TehA-like permease
MDNKIRSWLLLLTVALIVAALTGVPHLGQPGLVDSITLIILYLIDGR